MHHLQRQILLIQPAISIICSFLSCLSLQHFRYSWTTTQCTDHTRTTVDGNRLLSVFTDCAVGRRLQVKHPLPLPTQSRWFAQHLLFCHWFCCEPMSNCSTTCHTCKSGNPSINGSDSPVQMLAQVRQYLQVHFWHFKQNLHKYFFTLNVVLRVWTSKEKGGRRRERKGGYRNKQTYAHTSAHNTQRYRDRYTCMYVLYVCVCMYKYMYQI